MRVQRTQRKVGSVTVSGVGHGSEGSEVVDPVEVRGGERDVETSEEKVDGVRVFGSKGRGERTSDPGGGGGRSEFGVGSGGCG